MAVDEREKLLVNQFIKGITNPTVKNALIFTEDLRLAQAVTKADRFDINAQQQRLDTNIRKPGVAACTLDHTDTSQIVQEQDPTEIKALGQNTKPTTCFGCNQPGHFVRDCPNKKQNTSSQRSNTPENKGGRNQSADRSKSGYPGGYFIPPFQPFFMGDRPSRRDSYYGKRNGNYKGSYQGGSQGRNRSGSYYRSGSRASSYRSQSGDRSVSCGRKCFACSGFGHIADECPTRKRDKRIEGGGSRTRGTCHNCGKTGHYAANCSGQVGPVHSSKERRGKKKDSPKELAQARRKQSA